MGRYVVTGASRGIGRQVVERLLRHHEVIGVGRSTRSLDFLPEASRLIVDLDQPASLAAATSGAVSALGRLDGLVHCAGVAARGGIEQSSVEEWQRELALNVVAPAELTRLFLPALRAARGTVVFVNSGQGRTASGSSTVYASSKFALRGLADSLRDGEPSLRVCSVFPGRVATQMQRDLRGQEGGAYEPAKYLQPETVAAAIVGALLAPADASVTDVVLRPRG